MPVRSLHSSVIRWPDRKTVEASLRTWVREEARRHPRLRRLGFFGSYAHHTWGVGSDLDLVAVVADADVPFERRSLSWKLEDLPVPAELLVYTAAEWRKLQQQGGRFITMLLQETVWVYPEDQSEDSSSDRLDQPTE
jgi:predicted nucleotidyltransferase